MVTDVVPSDTLLVFLGHGDDAREEAEAIYGLQSELQRQMDSHLAVMPPGSRLAKLKIFEWRSDLKPAVGGQRQIEPFLESAHVAIFVFKARIGPVTWDELTAFRGRDSKCPVIVLFPTIGPSDMFDLGAMEAWTDLLKKQKELTSDWSQQESKAVTPVEAYRDKNHLLEIVRGQFARIISGLLKGTVPIGRKEVVDAGWIGSDAELRIAYERTAPSRHPCNGVRLEDFDWTLVQEFADKELGRAAGDLPSDKLLGELGLYSPLAAIPMAHKAAVLCFCGRPQRFFPEATASFVLGEPASDSLTVKEVAGPLSKQVSVLVELAQSHLGKVSRFERGQRLDDAEIPANVVREAIANAVAHRNYEINGTVQVRLSDSWLEIQNPGSFPAGTSWTVFLGKGPLSKPFDMAIQYYLKKQTQMEVLVEASRSSLLTLQGMARAA